MTNAEGAAKVRALAEAAGRDGCEVAALWLDGQASGIEYAPPEARAGDRWLRIVVQAMLADLLRTVDDLRGVSLRGASRALAAVADARHRLDRLAWWLLDADVGASSADIPWDARWACVMPEEESE